MSGSHTALIVMPIVIAVALFSWLTAVMWAGFHPRWKHHSQGPRTEVAGGAFQAIEGGRQLMPIPGHRSAPDDEIAALVEEQDEEQNVNVPAARAPEEREPASSTARSSSASASTRGASVGRTDNPGSGDYPPSPGSGNNPPRLVAAFLL
jgi:hypothetical protein